MAKKSSVEKEKRRERLVKLKWEKRQELKKTILDMSKSETERMDAVYKLNALPKNSSKVRLRNRCQLTGRARGYYRKFQMSRLTFRELASAGFIPGVIKASW
jgi:small subunit ribosomal protein S14